MKKHKAPYRTHILAEITFPAGAHENKHTFNMPTLTLAATKPRSSNAVPVAIAYSHTSEEDGKLVWLDADATASGDAAQTVRVQPDTHLTLEPSRTGRDIVYIAGSSGSGKGHAARMYALRYAEIYPDRNILLISALESDETLDKLKPRLKRIRLQSLLETPLTLEEVTNSLVITDDVDTLVHDKALDAAVQAVITLIASQGRHTNTSLVCCQHLLTNGKQTRLILSEASHYVVFPHGCSASQFRWLLSTYAGLDNHQVKMLRKMPSRWVAVRKLYPPLYVADGACGLLNE